jgi:serine/threonine-protein kinase HipA
LAARARLPEKRVLNTARETVALFHEHWHAEKKNLPLTKDVIGAVEAHVKKVPIGGV